MKRLLQLAAGFAVAVTGSLAFPAVFTVDLHGGGDYDAIQPAIDAAQDGDTVWSKPGEYVTGDTSSTMIAPVFVDSTESRRAAA